MGRKALPPEERARRQKLSKAKHYAKKKGKPKSWLNQLAKKMDAVGETAAPAMPVEDATPPDRPGEPFADLPPLDLPGSAPAADSTSESTQTDQPPSSDATAPSADSAKSKADEKQAFLNTEQLAEMVEGMVAQGTLKLGEYAAARGFFALGDYFAMLAGKSAAIIVRANATRLDIAPEEAAAWIVVGVAGTNGVQAFRAFRAERKAEEEKKHEPVRATAPAPQHVNGAAAPERPPVRRPFDEKQIVLRPGALV